MTEFVLSATNFGGYISPAKLVVFCVLFFLWLPLLGWVYRDAIEIGAREDIWTGVIFAAGATAAMLFALMPLFIVGLLFYVVTLLVCAVSYVIHRNAKVPEIQRVITPDHIKGLFTSSRKEIKAFKDLAFVTANGNEVPMPAVKSVDFLGFRAAHEVFNDAMWRRASDIVMAPTQQSYNVVYYVDGMATRQPDMARDQAEHLVHFLKNLGDLDTLEKRKPQKNRFWITREGEKNQWEISTAGSTAGERVTLRQVSQRALTSLADLGLAAEQQERLNALRDRKEGLFIVSGTAKNGVTTTFYAILKNNDPFVYNINTLEKQPSAELPNITQNVFTLSDTGTSTYGKRLQAVARMGPDILGVADCSDGESATMACTAAADGKVLYVTLGADSALQALAKWIKLVGDRKQAIDKLIGISCQALLRKLCEECRQAYEPQRDLLKKFNIPAEKVKAFYRAGKVQYDKHGKAVTCEHCQGSGYVGRVGVFELVTFDEEMIKGILTSKSLAEVGTLFRKAKMFGLQEQAMRKVINGTTSINEMLRVLSAVNKTQAAGKSPKQAP